MKDPANPAGRNSRRVFSWETQRETDATKTGPKTRPGQAGRVPPDNAARRPQCQRQVAGCRRIPKGDQRRFRRKRGKCVMTQQECPHPDPRAVRDARRLHQALTRRQPHSKRPTVLLIGSRAAGTHQPQSDTEILVLPAPGTDWNGSELKRTARLLRHFQQGRLSPARKRNQGGSDAKIAMQWNPDQAGNPYPAVCFSQSITALRNLRAMPQRNPTVPGATRQGIPCTIAPATCNTVSFHATQPHGQQEAMFGLLAMGCKPHF